MSHMIEKKKIGTAVILFEARSSELGVGRCLPLAVQTLECGVTVAGANLAAASEAL